MKPQPQNYTVHEVEGGYQVHTTYDLFHTGKPWPRGQLYKTSYDAFCNANNMYIRDMKEGAGQKMTNQQLRDAIEGIELLLAAITQQLYDIRKQLENPA